MNNKVLVELIVPEIEEKYNVYLPIHKRIGNIIVLLNKSIDEFTNGVYKGNSETSLYSATTGEQYPIDKILYETDIRNGQQLVLL